MSLGGSPLEKRIHVECAKCVEGSTFNDCLHPMMVMDQKRAASVPYRFVWREGNEVQSAISDLFDYGDDDPVSDSFYLQEEGT